MHKLSPRFWKSVKLSTIRGIFVSVAAQTQKLLPTELKTNSQWIYNYISVATGARSVLSFYFDSYWYIDAYTSIAIDKF